MAGGDGSMAAGGDGPSGSGGGGAMVSSGDSPSTGGDGDAMADGGEDDPEYVLGNNGVG